MLKTFGGRMARMAFLGALTGMAVWTGASSLAADEKRVSDGDLVTWATKRVQDWQPSAAERRFDEIGWAADIRTAERLSKEHNRPVFLFTHDGRMAVGRC
jgi:hypothetical protein